MGGIRGMEETPMTRALLTLALICAAGDGAAFFADEDGA